MKSAPPLRFLATVVGGWVCLRAAMLIPEWVAEVARLPAAAAARTAAYREVAEPSVRPKRSRGTLAPGARLPTVSAALDGVSRLRSTRTGLGVAPVFVELVQPLESMRIEAATQDFARPLPEPVRAEASRWSASAWTFVRRGEARGLGTSGTLGGSQIGGRIGYRIGGDAERPLSLAARFYSPMNDRAGSEAALGLEWKPFARLPVRVLAERRQAIGRDGRSAFALLAHGGMSNVPLVGSLKLEAYAQAGIVGGRSRDLFADGFVAAALPLDAAPGLSIGGGVWAAAQPGISRVDIGPRLSLALPGAKHVRLIADWRFRLLGDASPASGPSLTLAADF